MVDWQSTRFVPHALEDIKHGVTPTEIPELVYTQWCEKYEATADEVDVQRIVYQSDGLAVTGVMVMPKAMPADGLPLLIFNRGGCGRFGMLAVGFIMSFLIPLAKKGYVVLASNYRGNDGGEGQEEFGGAEVNDILRLLELGKTLPQWDGQHVYMVGWSRGGMMTLLALKAGADVLAAVTIAGVTDCVAALEYRPEMRQVYDRFIPYQGEDALMEKLRERSAVYWPEAIKVPLMIFHGDADDRVHVSQAQRLVEKLEALGAEYQVVYYAGGNHFLNTQRIQMLDEIDVFLRGYRV